jgi:hypothetical protein
MNKAQTVWKWLREDGNVNVSNPGPSITTDAVGSNFPGVDEALAALATPEAEFSAAFRAAEALAASGEFVTQAEKDKVLKRLVPAWSARREARRKFADAIESETARSAAEEAADVEIAEASAAMLELVAAMEVEADRIARASVIRSAARDKNPKARQSRSPSSGGRRPGGNLIAQLRGAVESIGQPSVYVLERVEVEKYRKGEPATDVLGREVPEGLPAKRVRRAYFPTSLRPYDVTAYGLRPIENGEW